MGRLSVRLFGRFDAAYEDESGAAARPLRALDAHKLQQCFSYLLLHRNRVFPREVLAELITPEVSAEQSRKVLRQVLWQLQTALTSSAAPTSLHEPVCSDIEGAEHDRPLVVDAEWVYVNPDCPLWLDVGELDDVFGRYVGQAGETLTAEAAERIRCAVALYRGDLLEGCYSEWCLLERERLQSTYLALLDKLMGYCTAHAEYEAGLAYGQIILGYDRARERTHQRMMLLHSLSGDRTGALRQYRACTAALNEELGVSPSRRTTEIYRHIADGGIDIASSPAAVSGTAGATPEGSPAQTTELPVADSLRTAFWALVSLQQQVNRQVATLESLIDSASSISPSQASD